MSKVKTSIGSLEKNGVNVQLIGLVDRDVDTDAKSPSKTGGKNEMLLKDADDGFSKIIHIVSEIIKQAVGKCSPSGQGTSLRHFKNVFWTSKRLQEVLKTFLKCLKDVLCSLGLLKMFYIRL